MKKKTKSMKEKSLEPFNKDPDPDGLFNICTGKSCKKSTQEFFFNEEKVLHRNA